MKLPGILAILEHIMILESCKKLAIIAPDIDQIMASIEALHDYISKSRITKNEKIDIFDIERSNLNTIRTCEKSILNIIGKAFSICDDKALNKEVRQKYLQLGINLEVNKKYSKTIISLIGPITYYRNALRPKSDNDMAKLMELEGKKAIYPLDDWYNLSNLKFKMTPYAMLKVTELAVQASSFEKSSSIASDILKIPITHETIRNVTEYIGDFVFNRELKLAEETYNLFMRGNKCSNMPIKSKIINEILYCEVDGSMVHVRKNEDDKENDTTGFCENKLGMFFSSDNMEFKCEDEHGKHYKIKKREYVTYIGHPDNFKKLLLKAALRNGYGNYATTVLISDGAQWIRNVKDDLFPNSYQILDFWHLSEHIHNFAKTYYENNKEASKDWAEKAKNAFKNGGHEKAICEIEKMELNIKVLDNENRHKLSNYLKTNIKNINYKFFNQNGWLTSSAHIESSNRTVAQERFKSSRMIWNIENIQKMLTLKAKDRSNLWGIDVVTPFIKHIRDHGSSL